MNRICALCVICGSLHSVSSFAAESVAHLQGHTLAARQWDVLDIRFEVDQIPGQPIDVDFTATFKHDDSPLEMQAPGFFNGRKEYVIRFTPPADGTWNYSTQSSLPDLNGHAGKLSVGQPRKGRKGGIVVEPNRKREFLYENGDDYYPIAFECDWLFALDADNDSDIPITKKFVDQLADSGFNQIIMNVFAYDVTWKKDENLKPEHEYGSPKAFPFGGTNDEPDHSKLNIEYFKRLDRVIDCLDQKGIAAHLMIYVWNKRVNWPETGSEADNRYFDYVVKRYQACPNIIWDISKEALAYGHTDMKYVTGRIDRLRGLDRFKRLVTVHDYSYCRRYPQKLDFISVQLWGSELYSVMRKVYNDLPGKPILNIEHGGYEKSPYVVFTGNYTSAEACLERAWQCVFAGTYPTHYWQGAAWNVIIPDIDTLKPKERPRLEYYRHMQSFVERYKVGRLVAGEKKSASGFCLHDNKDLFIYYVPKENSHIDVRLPKDARGQMMKGEWFDPFTGEFKSSFTGKIPQWPRYKKPESEGFMILIVELQSGGQN